jgi:hypothetical protein
MTRKPIIPQGAGVRCDKTQRLGRVFRNPQGNIRGHIFVQWDGARDRCTVALRDVTYVAASYETAKAWDAAKAVTP